MAEPISNFEFTRQGRGRKAEYDKYMDGQVWKLEIGVDLPGTMESARSAMIAAAKTRGFRIRTQKLDDQHIVVQAFKEVNNEDEDDTDS